MYVFIIVNRIDKYLFLFKQKTERYIAISLFKAYHLP